MIKQYIKKAVSPQHTLQDPPLRNGLAYPRVNENTEESINTVASFSNLIGVVSDNAVLVAAFASKQDALSYTPLDPANNLSELESIDSAIANLGLDAGGEHDIWLRRTGDRLTGAIEVPVITTTDSAYTVGNERITLCDATSNAITVSLSTAATRKGRMHTIKKIDSSVNAITIDPHSSETIDGASTHTLSSQYDTVTLVSDGTEWFIISVI